MYRSNDLFHAFNPVTLSLHLLLSAALAIHYTIGSFYLHTMNNFETDQQQVATTTTFDEGRLYQFQERLRLEQNLPLALIGGFAAALIGALLWATITVITHFQIGFMAVGVGFIVGYTVRFFGKGLDTLFGVMGAFLALLGCLLGNFFSMVGFAAMEEGYGYFEILQLIDYNLVPAIMMDSFSGMDLFFYGIAIYEGYRFSFRQLSEDGVMVNATTQDQ